MTALRALVRSALVSTALLVLGSASVLAQDLAITNAHILDPESETVSEGVLLVVDGRVAELTDAVPAGFSGDVLDAEGRFLIPAFADLHTHSFGNRGPGTAAEFLGPLGSMKRALAVGVVGVLDLFSPEGMILPFRDGQNRDGGVAAELFVAGPCFTATNGHCSQFGVPTRIVNTPEEARSEVTDLAGSNPDVLKLVYDNETYSGNSRPTVDRATMEAFVDQARQQGIPSVIHVGTWEDALHVAQAGAAAITHTPAGQPPQHVIDALVQAETVSIPTLAVQGDFSRIADDPTLVDGALIRATHSGEFLDAHHSLGDADGMVGNWLAWQRTLRDDNLIAVKALHDAGVEILTGTDAGNFGVFQGYSVHRELALFVEAGLTPWAALRAGSTRAKSVLDLDLGVHPGAEASFLLLEDSPITDIRNTEGVHMVIHKGVVVDREALLQR